MDQNNYAWIGELACKTLGLEECDPNTFIKKLNNILTERSLARTLIELQFNQMGLPQDVKDLYENYKDHIRSYDEPTA